LTGLLIWNMRKPREKISRYPFIKQVVFDDCPEEQVHAGLIGILAADDRVIVLLKLLLLRNRRLTCLREEFLVFRFSPLSSKFSFICSLSEQLLISFSTTDFQSPRPFLNKKERPSIQRIELVNPWVE
jgi:hypothetical protein